MNGPLLIIAHEATRTGSPRVLADLLGYAKDHLRVPLVVRTLAGGPLESELVGMTDVASAREKPSVLLVNGSAAAAELHSQPPGTASIVYVHEQGEALATLPADARAALRGFTKVLCVSRIAENDLSELGVDPDRIEILPPVVPQRKALDAGTVADELGGFIGSRPLIAGCGEAGWRKGADLFVDVARRVAEQRDVGFVWIGRRPRSFSRILDNDTASVRLTDCLVWLGEVPDAAPYLAASELLVMTSREDPQPLVPLEASFQGAATVGFAVGGINDLAESGLAEVVDYPDTRALAQLCVDLLDDGPRRHTLGTAARDYTITERSLATIGDRFVKIVEEVREQR